MGMSDVLAVGGGGVYLSDGLAMACAIVAFSVRTPHVKEDATMSKLPITIGVVLMLGNLGLAQESRDKEFYATLKQLVLQYQAGNLDSAYSNAQTLERLIAKRSGKQLPAFTTHPPEPISTEAFNVMKFDQYEIQKKDKGVAFAYSWFFPGGGNMYAGSRYAPIYLATSGAASYWLIRSIHRGQDVAGASIAFLVAKILDFAGASQVVDQHNRKLRQRLGLAVVFQSSDR